jgi:hypothetical protein
MPVVILKRSATSYPRTVRLGVGCRQALQDDTVACLPGWRRTIVRGTRQWQVGSES